MDKGLESTTVEKTTTTTTTTMVSETINESMERYIHDAVAVATIGLEDSTSVTLTYGNGNADEFNDVALSDAAKAYKPIPILEYNDEDADFVMNDFLQMKPSSSSSSLPSSTSTDNNKNDDNSAAIVNNNNNHHHDDHIERSIKECVGASLPDFGYPTTINSQSTVEEETTTTMQSQLELCGSSDGDLYINMNFLPTIFENPQLPQPQPPPPTTTMCPRKDINNCMEVYKSNKNNSAAEESDDNTARNSNCSSSNSSGSSSSSSSSSNSSSSSASESSDADDDNVVAAGHCKKISPTENIAILQNQTPDLPIDDDVELNATDDSVRDPSYDRHSKPTNANKVYRKTKSVSKSSSSSSSLGSSSDDDNDGVVDNTKIKRKSKRCRNRIVKTTPNSITSDDDDDDQTSGYVSKVYSSSVRSLSQPPPPSPPPPQVKHSNRLKCLANATKTYNDRCVLLRKTLVSKVLRPRLDRVDRRLPTLKGLTSKTHENKLKTLNLINPKPNRLKNIHYPLGKWDKTPLTEVIDVQFVDIDSYIVNGGMSDSIEITPTTITYPDNFNLVSLKQIFTEGCKEQPLFHPSKLHDDLMDLSQRHFSQQYYVHRREMNNVNATNVEYCLVAGAIPAEYSYCASYLMNYYIDQHSQMVKHREEGKFKKYSERELIRLDRYLRAPMYAGELELMCYIYWHLESTDLINWKDNVSRKQQKDLLKYCCSRIGKSELSDSIVRLANFDTPYITGYCLLKIKMVFEDVIENLNSDAGERQNQIDRDLWYMFMQRCGIHHYMCPHTITEINKILANEYYTIASKLDNLDCPFIMRDATIPLNVRCIRDIIVKSVPNLSTQMPKFKLTKNLSKCISSVVVFLCRSIAEHLSLYSLGENHKTILAAHIRGFFKQLPVSIHTNERPHLEHYKMLLSTVHRLIAYEVQSIDPLLSNPQFESKVDSTVAFYIRGVFLKIFEPLISIDDYKKYCDDERKRQGKAYQISTLLTEAISQYFDRPEFQDIKNMPMWQDFAEDDDDNDDDGNDYNNIINQSPNFLNDAFIENTTTTTDDDDDDDTSDDDYMANDDEDVTMLNDDLKFIDSYKQSSLMENYGVCPVVDTAISLPSQPPPPPSSSSVVAVKKRKLPIELVDEQPQTKQLKTTITESTSTTTLDNQQVVSIEGHDDDNDQQQQQQHRQQVIVHDYDSDAENYGEEYIPMFVNGENKKPKFRQTCLKMLEAAVYYTPYSDVKENSDTAVATTAEMDADKKRKRNKRTHCILCGTATTSLFIGIENKIAVQCCITCTTALVWDYSKPKPRFDHVAIRMRLERNLPEPVAFKNGAFINTITSNTPRTTIYNRLSPHSKQNISKLTAAAAVKKRPKVKKTTKIADVTTTTTPRAISTDAITTTTTSDDNNTNIYT